MGSNLSADQQQDWLAKVQKIAEDVCLREGCWLYDIEFLGTQGGRTLRVYVDKDGGAGIEDCSNVSKGLNLMLDVDDLVPGGHYNLEVSTPGVDRHLSKPWHYEKAVGKKIRVRTRGALETLGVTDKKWKAAKQVEEVLASTDGASVTFEVKEGPIRIPFDAIEKAKMVFEAPAKGQKKK